MREYGWNRHSKIYWSQFEHQGFVLNPSVDFFKFIVLLVVCGVASLYIDHPTTKQILIFVAGTSAVVLLILLGIRKKVI